MLKQQLDVLEQHSTQGPVGGSCVTLLIPAHHSAERLSAFLTQETATAQNIKDKKNGKSVVAAFAQIKSWLAREAKDARSAKNRGFAFFVAPTLGVCECIAVEPPVVLLRFHYWCDSHFDTTLLRDAVEAAERDDCVVQYVVVGGDGFTLANVREQDGHITVLSRPHDPNLPRKQNKGGQSAPRFGRLRENALHAYAKHVAESIEKQWPAYTADAKTSKKNEQKMVVAGSGMLKDAVVAELSPLIQKRIAATFDTQYNGLAGLQHAVDATLAQVSGNAQLKADLNKLQQLFDTLQRKEDANDDTVRVAIGRAEVDRALAINAAQRVLQHVQVEDWACLDETVTITRVSAQSGAAQMFLSGFGGIVAYLRFSVPRSLLLVPNEGGEEEDGDDETEWI